MFGNIITNEQLLDLAVLALELEVQLLVGVVEMLLQLLGSVLMQRHDVMKRLELIERTPVQVLEKHGLTIGGLAMRLGALLAVPTRAYFKVEVALDGLLALPVYKQRVYHLVVGDLGDFRLERLLQANVALRQLVVIVLILVV